MKSCHIRISTFFKSYNVDLCKLIYLFVGLFKWIVLIYKQNNPKGISVHTLVNINYPALVQSNRK